MAPAPAQLQQQQQQQGQGTVCPASPPPGIITLPYPLVLSCPAGRLCKEKAGALGSAAGRRWDAPQPDFRLAAMCLCHPAGDPGPAGLVATGNPTSCVDR